MFPGRAASAASTQSAVKQTCNQAAAGLQASATELM